MAMINYVPHAYSNLESFFFSHIQFQAIFFFWILWDFVFVFLGSCLHSYLA